MNLENYILSLDNDFVAQLLTIDGKIDLAVGLVCALIAFFVSQFIIKKYLLAYFNFRDHGGRNFICYLLMRAAFPLTAILLFMLNYLRFLLMTDQVSVVYPALIWLAMWLLIIRVITGVFLFVFPRGALRYTLGNIMSFLFWVAYLVWWTGSNVSLAHLLSTIKIKIGPVHFTLLSMFYAIVTAVIILSISLWLNKLIELKINQTRRIDSTFKHVILRISKFIVFFVVILSILPVLGIDLTTISVFSGALGVGIGIGLQKFIGNIFSGIMILMDRSIKIGDRLVVGEHTGYVSKITSRHIVLQSLDHSEILVPNERFVFDTIVNQSYTDTTLRVELHIGVAYGSDLELALKLLLDAAADNPALDSSRPPTSGIEAFGDFAINLILLIWIKDPRESMIQSKTEIYLKIVKLFAEHQVEIPVPKQDLRITRS